MIFDYGFSFVGKSHLKNGTCCQDSHKIKKLNNGWYIAAVADGVGSASNAETGARIAVNTVVEFCDEHMPLDLNTSGIIAMIRTAYEYAFKKILMEAEKECNPVESYDTTLSMVIFDGHKVIYGHSGDGGIFALTETGEYVEVTKPQKGEDHVSVLPLRAGFRSWDIGLYEEPVKSVVLVTDGMRDSICHYLLRLTDNRLYVPLLTFFADPECIPEESEQQELLREDISQFIQTGGKIDASVFYKRLEMIYEKRVKDKKDEIIEKMLEKNYSVGLVEYVQDDRTIVGLINTDVQVESKAVSYYAEPDWEGFQEKWNRLAYPHLYTEGKTEDTDTTSSGENTGNVDDGGSLDPEKNSEE